VSGFIKSHANFTFIEVVEMDQVDIDAEYAGHMAAFMQGFAIFCVLLWLAAGAVAGVAMYHGHNQNLQSAVFSDQPATDPGKAGLQ
jgi:hypothetical protein